MNIQILWTDKIVNETWQVLYETISHKNGKGTSMFPLWNQLSNRLTLPELNWNRLNFHLRQGRGMTSMHKPANEIR